MKKLLALFLVLVMAVSVFAVSVNAKNIDMSTVSYDATDDRCISLDDAVKTYEDISDELLEAVRADYAGVEGIEKSDIYLFYNLHISGDKFLVRLMVSGCMYPDDIVNQTIGNYRLISTRPTPQIFTGGALYEIKYAYENRIISDSDLAVISTFDELCFSYVDDTDDVQDDKYKDRLLLQYELYDVEKAGELTYIELGEIDVDTDDAMDYAVIYSRVAIGSDAMTYLDLKTRYIHNPQICYPFYYCYALYDIENFKFIPIEEMLNGDYPFIYDCIEEFEIGRPFGDADNDGEITVLDATEIQRDAANLREHKLGLGSDINRDKVVDVLDATAIQRKIAGL